VGSATATADQQGSEREQSAANARGVAALTSAARGLRDITVSMSANSLSLVNGYVRMGYGVGLVSLSPVLVSQWMESGGHDLHLRDVSKLFGKESVFMLHRTRGHEMSHVRAFREAVVKG
jgi:DNA-binding transcriptional LysR family regulator